MHKLSHLVDGEWIEHAFEPQYLLPARGEHPRIIAAVPSGGCEPFEGLVACITPPYFILYVLHTPRGEGEPGRYQSPPVSVTEFAAFMARFGSYLATDARFDLWVHSPTDSATVVWDRHNLLFAYGPLLRFEEALCRMGFASGACAVPAPHQHHYHAANDEAAAELLTWCEWNRSPLRAEDVQ